VSSERFVLKHFYYGQFVRDGNPGGDMRLLAKTHGLHDATIQEALAVGLLPPMAGQNQGSWAILRGRRTLPFVLVESERGSDGQLMLHYVVLPSDLVRRMGGNLKALHPLIEGDMPAYDRVNNIINPLVISDIAPPDEGQEVDDILDFMMFTKNRMDVIESLLSAVVQNIPVYIVNAPENPTDRELFITGLLVLLPPSVRYAVTFATHTLENTNIETQVRFYSGQPPEDALTFDWKNGKITGKKVSDNYSKFIVSQLRLDVELVIKQTRDLTAIAQWRMRQTNTRLASALAYASQRVSVDDAVRNRQPVEAAEVAHILATDTTLSDELRVEYARHLMSFSLALGELEHAQPLGIMLGNNGELADTAFEMLKNALRNGAAGDIFDLMAKWMDSPMGPRGDRWVKLTHECAKIYLNDIIDAGDLDEVQLFLRDVDRAGASVMAGRLLPSLLKIAMPVAVMNEGLAHTVFILGCKHLTHTDLYNILSNQSFAQLMPEEARKFVAAVRAGRTQEKLLLAAASAYRNAQRLILVRFVEIAMQHNLPGLVDTLVLRQLVKVALADWGHQYNVTLQLVVNALLEEEMLKSRGEEDARLLLELLLAMGSYNELARAILDQSRLLYIGDRQAEFAVMVGRVFAEAPIDEEQIPAALQAMKDGGIRSLPLLLAYIGAVESHEPSDISNQIADEALDMIANSLRLLDVMPLDAMLALTQFQFKRKDDASILRAAWFLPMVAARYGQRAASALGTVYKNMSRPGAMQDARIDMLRRYIRFMDPTEGRAAADDLAKQLGREVGEALEATYAVKLLRAGLPIEQYVEQLHTLADFLFDTAEAYAGRTVPSQGAILNDLESMPGGLSREDSIALARQLVAAGKSACVLADAHNNVRGAGTDNRVRQLLSGEEEPRSALEILWVMGGFLADGKRYEVDLNRSRQNPHPLPKRTTTRIKDEVHTARDLFESMAMAFPPNENRRLQAEAVRAELDSMWRELPANTQKALLQNLATDLQRVAELIPVIASKNDLRALEDTGLGRRLEENSARPRNVIEFYRFTAGYFLQRRY